MSEVTGISWTDHTFNGWWGCAKVSPGCEHCYAEALDRRTGGDHWGTGKARRRTSEANWRQPLKWDRDAAAMLVCEHCGFREPREPAIRDERCRNCDRGQFRPYRARVFSASMSDWLDDEVPVEWLADLLGLIQATPHLDWQLLTKRPENWQSRLCAVVKLTGDVVRGFGYHGRVVAHHWLEGKPLANVWVGCTVENQKCADERIRYALDIPARVHGLSCEPLLEAVDLTRVSAFRSPPWPSSLPGEPPTYLNVLAGAGLRPSSCGVSIETHVDSRIDWVIVGGESGPGFRPMNMDHARSIIAQCQAANVPVFVKQDSGFKSGTQGRFTDAEWALKQFPEVQP